MSNPKLLIIGEGEHGKDTVAELLSETYGLSFESSSRYVGKWCVWPAWGSERYETFEEMYDDRRNNREVWQNLVAAYNTPDKARTAREMLMDMNLNMYVGMRDPKEFAACLQEGLFDVIIWVDASKRCPNESNPLERVNAEDADYILDNNGPEDQLPTKIQEMVDFINEMQFLDEDLLPVKPPEPARKPDKFELQTGIPTPTSNIFEEVVSSAGGQADQSPDVVEPEEENPAEDMEVDLSVQPEDAINVLDHGYVALVNVNGTDSDIAEAARLSYGRGTKKVNKEEGLIRYLYMNAHTSPFEMVSMKFQMRLPIFIMRQLVRHRTAHLNEYSGRYSIMPELFYVPHVDQICLQDQNNKQGSAEPLEGEEAEMIQHAIRIRSEESFQSYKQMLKRGVSRETARIILPLNTYTEVMWQMDLNNMLKFLWLRDDSHAQWEIRVYAQIISNLVKEHFPKTFAAYERKRNSVSMTREQVSALVNKYTVNLPKGEAAQVEALLSEHKSM